MDLFDDFLCQLKSQLHPNSAVLLGLSGGIDSMVLLHLFYLYQKKYPSFLFRAVFIHHGLSENADFWQNHCESECNNRNIPFSSFSVQLDKSQGNIEEQARNARYSVFKKLLESNEILAIAQHLDDQCETVLLALKRGSGPLGISGISQNRQFSIKNRIIRPLLSFSRNQIENYARFAQINWIEDESNQSLAFDRNFLRNEILPKIYSRWPKFAETTKRSAELCFEQEMLINELLDNEFKQLIDENNSLDLQYLRSCSQIKTFYLLRKFFSFHQIKMPSRAQIERILIDFIYSANDANPKQILQQKELRRFQDKLYILPIYQSVENCILNWNLKDPLDLPENIGKLYLLNHQNLSDILNQTLKMEKKNQCENRYIFAIRAPNNDEKITIRFHAQGNFRVIGRNGTRKIKKIWQELNVPSWERTRIPLIFYNEELIAAAGFFITENGYPIDGKSICLEYINLKK